MPIVIKEQEGPANPKKVQCPYCKMYLALGQRLDVHVNKCTKKPATYTDYDF